MTTPEELDELVYKDDPALCGDPTCYGASCRQSALDEYFRVQEQLFLKAFGLKPE